MTGGFTTNGGKYYYTSAPHKVVKTELRVLLSRASKFVAVLSRDLGPMKPTQCLACNNQLSKRLHDYDLSCASQHRFTELHLPSVSILRRILWSTVHVGPNVPWILGRR